MFIWNRREIFMGFSLNDFNKICNQLQSSHIRYDYNIVNQNNTRGRLGSFGENSNYSTMYYIYVHKKDYDKVNGLGSR